MFWLKSSQPQPQEAATPTDNRGVLRDQVKNGIETYRFATGLLVQTYAFLAAAVALLFGYGLNLRIVAPMIFAGLLPISMLVAYVILLQSMLPIEPFPVTARPGR